MIRKGSMLYFANNDYSFLMSHPDVNLYKDRALYMCQQIVEQYLKHLLRVHFQEINETHNISYMVNKLIKVYPILRKYRSIVTTLRECYYDRNYENVSYFEYDDNDFNEIYSEALELIEYLRSVSNMDDIIVKSNLFTGQQE